MEFVPHRWAVVDDLMISVTLAGPSTDAVWQSFARDIVHHDVTRYIGVALACADVTSVRRKILADALLLKNGRRGCVHVVGDGCGHRASRRAEGARCPREGGDRAAQSADLSAVVRGSWR
ncbi:Hypothetical protein CAP_3633 [Chondromyces apiculatus DSM 436]|uniref:Uncharacterized protein n=1 Tax=Chondromyces apiculatus DSM 436 TaxID=1192034 RepID=A0A017T736_9BACT|nr:Hypothetical protein CAP_3633 [Chondromyces apiculatus DSM 436]